MAGALLAEAGCGVATLGLPTTPGLAAIAKAKDIGAKTERERDYIDALMVMYADYDKVPHAQRMRALRDA